MADGKNWVCQTCGLQFDKSEKPPGKCKTCEDERQYVGADGQKWTTIEDMVRDGYTNKIEEHEDSITGIGTEPYFGIGQRALLVQTSEGNILWDCVTVLDQKTIDEVNARGGVKAIAISHPHFYSAMVEWSQKFNAPVYVHEWDKHWVARSEGGDIKYWSGDSCDLFGGCKLHRLGGHFPGSAILRIDSAKSDGKSVALTGDTIQCTKRTNFVSYMYAYPNYIPLPRFEVENVKARLQKMPRFDRIYGGWWTTKVETDAYDHAIEGANRYLRALDGEYLKDYPDRS